MIKLQRHSLTAVSFILFKDRKNLKKSVHTSLQTAHSVL